MSGKKLRRKRVSSWVSTRSEDGRSEDICVAQEKQKQHKKIRGKSSWTLGNVTSSPQIDDETNTVERNEDENESRVGLSTRSEDGSTISTKKREEEKSV